MVKHQTRFWWSCPACLEEKRRESIEQLRNMQGSIAELERVSDWTKKTLDKLKGTAC